MAKSAPARGPRPVRGIRRCEGARSPQGEGHVGDSGDNAGNQRVGGVHQQLRRLPVGILEPAFEVPRDEYADHDLVAQQLRFEFRRGGRPAHRRDDLGGGQVGNQPAGGLGIGLVGDTGAQPAYIHVDRVTEQRDENQRNADDHGESETVARQLPEFFLRDGPGSPQRVHGCLR